MRLLAHSCVRYIERPNGMETTHEFFEYLFSHNGWVCMHSKTQIVINFVAVYPPNIRRYLLNENFFDFQGVSPNLPLKLSVSKV